MSRLYVALGAIVAVLLLAGGAYLAGKSRGETQAKLAASVATADTIIKTIRVADTIYRDRVHTFTRWRTKTVAVRDTLLRHLTDTLLVKQYVAATDTALHACSDVVLSCDTVRARYARLVKQDSLTQRLLTKAKPSWLSVLRQRCGVSVGYGFVSGKPDVVAGCNVLP